MTLRPVLLITILFLLMFSGCQIGNLSAVQSTPDADTSSSAEQDDSYADTPSSAEQDDPNADTTSSAEQDDPNADTPSSDDSEENAGEEEVSNDIPMFRYDRSLFRHEGDLLFYDSDEYYSLCGIDVSYYQGDIDWQQVRDAGIEFAIIRAGFRGYGEEGSLNEDPFYRKNISGAKEAGLLVGVYFFSQALNEEEAAEEADFLLSLIDGVELDLPPAYDEEIIRSSAARTDNVTSDQFNLNALAFCRRLNEAGYESMLYANLIWEAFVYDLSLFPDTAIWYSDYEALPQTPYHFDFWQYKEDGEVPGIEGKVDMNIWMKKK